MARRTRGGLTKGAGALTLAGMLAALAVAGLAVTPAAAQGGGDANAGDVWVDTAGEPGGPGHEMDPHLGCGAVDVWGARLADASGTLQVVVIPPTGGGTAYSTTWHYSGSGAAVIATIPAGALAAAGASTNPNGAHFRLDVVQDPQKHKTFWVSCPSGAGGAAPARPRFAPARPASGGGTGGATGGVTPVSSPSAPVTFAAPVPSAAGVAGARSGRGSGTLAAATTSPAGAVKAASTSGGLGGASMPITGEAGLLATLVAGLLALAGGGVAWRLSRAAD